MVNVPVYTVMTVRHLGVSVKAHFLSFFFRFFLGESPFPRVLDPPLYSDLIAMNASRIVWSRSRWALFSALVLTVSLYRAVSETTGMS